MTDDLVRAFDWDALAFETTLPVLSAPAAAAARSAARRLRLPALHAQPDASPRTAAEVHLSHPRPGHASPAANP